LDTISVKWVNVALEAVRQIGFSGTAADRARIGPPMVARSLALLHTAIYDAWAVHDAVALPTRLRLVRVTGASEPSSWKPPSATLRTRCWWISFRPRLRALTR
jgi:hypothetical protein